NITGNVTTQFSDALRGRIAYNNSSSRTEGLLPALSGTELASTNYGKGTESPNYSLSGNIDWVATPRLFFGLRGGYYKSDLRDFDVTEIPRIIFSTGNNLRFPEVPANLQQRSGFQNIPTNFKTNRDDQTRGYFQADGTVYGSFAGDHQLKFGAQIDRVGNNVDAGESANLVRLRWDTSLPHPTRGDERGTYGYYQVRSNGVNPKRGFTTFGAVHTTNIGLFVQDAWTINKRLTINAGVRTERERVPTYATDVAIPEFGIEFDFKDKFAPRVGVAYDIKGDGRTKAFGSWGVFYDIFKLELPRGSFGGDRWLEYYYALDTFDWTSLTASPSCPPACPGRLLRGPIDFRSVSLDADHIDPDLKPMKQQEATFGVEHQLGNVLAVSARYVHKQVDRAIEDTGALDPSGTEIYIIANPGENLAGLAFTNPNVPNPKPVRDYDSVEFAAEKRFADNWYLRSSYLWSRLYGNYSGLSQSDENGRTSPNVGRLWDYPLMMFQDGGNAALGPLATDRPHQFKTQFIYQFGFGTALGVNQFVASGLPVSREIGIFAPNNLPVNYLGRGSDGRTPTFSQTDMLVQHSFRIGGTRQVQLSFNVLNLLSQDTATSRYSTYHKTNGVEPDEALFYAGRQTLASLITSQSVIQDARFLMDNAFQAPLQARIGLKFVF
ncbi:MAG: TonB-dependent receptor, partial [Acidobacteriota bacterium]|nr:TonB-dependent receptor [Acidobacteriota bacterium]